MSSMISRVREISRRIKDLEGLRATEDEANLFKTRAEDLSSLSDEIQKPADQIELFWNGSVAVETPTFQANQLKLQLEAIQNDYAADRKSVIAPSTKWRFDTKKGLESIARSSYQQLQTAWNGHLAEMRPATDSGLLRLLSRSTAFQAQSRRIEELVTEFDLLSNRLPSNTEELERPAKLARELQNLIRELPDDVPGPVRQLFQSINEGNATAAQLNQDAMQWLLDNDMLSDLKVSWRSG